MTKVFWSWQSDRPGKTGRHFVRDAIQEAIDAILAEGEVEESQRDLHLDHDRKGAPGSPDLARLILTKIQASAIFIADVTTVGQSHEVGEDGDPKPLINPNVAIELGYALATVGDAGLLMVMNKAYGGRETLPFDLSHKAGPILYELRSDATKVEIDAAKKGLAQQLKEAIRACAAALPPDEVQVLPQEAYVPIAPRDGQARFRAKGEALGSTDPFPQLTTGDDIPLLAGSALWLRVFPAFDTGYHRWASELRSMIRSQYMSLMMPIATYASTHRSVIAPDGYGLVSMAEMNSAESVTFVFERGEVWGINAFVLDANGIASAGQDERVIPFAHTAIVDAFKNFTALLRRPLEVPPPYRWILGMENIKGRRLVIPTPRGMWSQPMGRCLVDTVVAEGDYDVSDSHFKCLRPFFEQLVARCSLDPTDMLKGYPD